MFVLLLTVCTIGTGACRVEEVPTQAPAGADEMTCIHGAAQAILVQFPAMITDEGMVDGAPGHENERVRLKSFRCETRP